MPPRLTCFLQVSFRQNLARVVAWWPGRPLAVYYDTAEDEAIGGYANMGLACRPRPGADAIYEGRISNCPPEIALVLWLLFEHLPDTTC